MIQKWVEILSHHSDLRSYFYLIEIGLGSFFLFFLFRIRSKSPESNFRVRESDHKVSGGTLRQDGNSLAQAKIKKQEPLRLGGIRIDAPPHEILGVPQAASAQQIQQAYRELMKRYHPDRIGAQGSREWNDAQKIAEAINRAKEEMIRKISKR